MTEDPNAPVAANKAEGLHDGRDPATAPAENTPDPPGSVLKDYLLLLALLLPLVLYLISLHGRREDELLRYHREMISFADGAREALDAGAAVIFSAAHVEPPFEPVACAKPDPGAGYVRQPTGPRFVSIQQSFYAGLKRMPFRPCAISWTGSPGELTLHFSVDRPASEPASEPGSADHQKASAPNPEFRHRTSGRLDLHSRLAELAGLTGFDALLIADQSGELILKLGSSASLFSSLPLLNNDGWEKILEAKPAEKELSDVFVPSSIEQVERQVAGQDFTLFPREILLTPHQLLGSPYHCRAGQNGDSGQETLRLRAVGLVRTDRLTANALRPAEASYWYWCLSYLAAWLYILHRYRDKPDQSEAIPAWRRLAVVLSFGLTIGTLLGLLISCWGLWCWEDRRLRELAESFREHAIRQLDEAAAAIQRNAASLLVERFACVEGPLRGPYRMVRLQAGSRQELRPVFQPPLPFLEQPPEASPWVETLFSLVDGRKTTLLVQREQERTRTAALSLLALHRAMFPAGFGAALVEASGDSSLDWPLLLDSETGRETSKSFLAEFSNVDCVRLRVSEGQGYCSGRFRGHNARLRIDRLSSAHGAKREDLLGRFRLEGDLILVTYAYEELQNSQIEAATLAAVRLDLGLLVVALTVLWILARRGGLPAPVGRGWEKLRSWLEARSWHPHWLVRQHQPLLPAALGLGLACGYAAFAACWLMEDRIYATISASVREDACRATLDQLAGPAGAALDDHEARSAAIADFLGYAPVATEDRTTTTAYYLLRPSEGRLLASASRLSAGLASGGKPSRFSFDLAGSWSTLARLVLLAAGLAATLGLLVLFADSRWKPRRPRLGSDEAAWSWWGVGGLIAGALGLLVSIVYFEKLALAVFTALTSLGVLKTNLLSHLGNREKPQ